MHNRWIKRWRMQGSCSIQYVIELCADVIVSAVVRRSISGGGGGPPPVPKNRGRRRHGVGGQKHFFLRFTKKIRSILKIFLGTFIVIKALRFADDQMLAGSESDLQRMTDRLNMVSVNYNMKIKAKKTKVLRVSKGSESAG